MLVDILDGILDGQDVGRTAPVPVSDHGGLRGGLAGTGCTDAEHQATLDHNDLLERRRQFEFLDRGDRRLDMSHDDAGSVLLVEGADTETCDTLLEMGKVGLA